MTTTNYHLISRIIKKILKLREAEGNILCTKFLLNTPTHLHYLTITHNFQWLFIEIKNVSEKCSIY